MPLAKPFSLYLWVRMGLTNLPDFRLEKNYFWTEGCLQDFSRPLECPLLYSCFLSPCAEPTFHYREREAKRERHLHRTPQFTSFFLCYLFKIFAIKL